MAEIPGVKAKHAIITPNCRTVPRPEFDADPALAAFDEAVRRLREEYAAVAAGRTDGKWNGHLVFTVENLRP